MRSPLSVANGLTLARLIISPINVWSILEGRFVLSSALFVVAVVSDVFDGIFARREANPSRIGGTLDHSADCFFVSSALFALAIRGSVPLVLPILVVLAFIQYVLDSRVLQRQQLVPSKLGRWNGIAYFVVVGIVVGENALNFDWISNLWIRQTFSWVLVVSTILSIGERLILLGRRNAR
ncbi:MAG: CDP-alcohol phosphatidyltransferase family protein [Gammaproteobacteria bacterium]|nr:CDP-alcohol phosphatidyltransferase family protein [Gammaproteobacteria bacterium]MYF03164.1 CDP-alcohol phosphatidyltransferase family protein [Gammaproteobacteria bacterium]MYI77506.1 CDP-alcohol phosphatidyltransferase family protein [Gammaproteobacteria bacterium]